MMHVKQEAFKGMFIFVGNVHNSPIGYELLICNDNNNNKNSLHTHTVFIVLSLLSMSNVYKLRFNYI